MVTVEAIPTRLEIEQSLLAVNPLTPRPNVDTNGDLEDWAEITNADHRRDRGQLQQLVGAVKQRDRDQEALDELARENAQLKKEQIEAAEAEAKIKRPFWKAFGLF